MFPSFEESECGITTFVVVSVICYLSHFLQLSSHVAELRICKQELGPSHIFELKIPWSSQVSIVDGALMFCKILASYSLISISSLLIISKSCCSFPTAPRPSFHNSWQEPFSHLPSNPIKNPRNYHKPSNIHGLSAQLRVFVSACML
jgi:hypothetical protein